MHDDDPPKIVVAVEGYIVMVGIAIDRDCYSTFHRVYTEICIWICVIPKRQ